MSAPWLPFAGGEVPQMCTVDDLQGPLAGPCQRLAQWVWQSDPDDHPIYLCNYHAEPLTAGQVGATS